MDLLSRIEHLSIEELADCCKQEGMNCTFYSAFFRVLLLAKEQHYLPHSRTEDFRLILNKKGNNIVSHIQTLYKTNSDNLPLVCSYLLSDYKLVLINPLQEDDLGPEPDLRNNSSYIHYLRQQEYLSILDKLKQSKYAPNLQTFQHDSLTEIITENIGKKPLVGFSPEIGEYPVFPPILGHTVCLLAIAENKLTYFDPWDGKIKVRAKEPFYKKLKSDCLFIHRPREYPHLELHFSGSFDSQQVKTVF